MKVLVCTKTSIPATGQTIPDWGELWKLGYESCTECPDVIISMGVSVMEETFQAKTRYPQAKLFCYNWDCYEWVWTNPRPGEYDYNRYGQLLKMADEIWVPSNCTGIRTAQWWGLKDWKVIQSMVPFWEYEDVKDEGYALCCLRQIPDPWWGKFEQACEELGIPYKMPQHQESYEDYKKIVAGCRFLCSPLYELSTGGLSLLEGYYHGKPSLISDSAWNGAHDYFGNLATYFEYGDYRDFKEALTYMYRRTPTVRPGYKEYVSINFSSKAMVARMHSRIMLHAKS